MIWINLVIVKTTVPSFRLLNSEIGNDQEKEFKSNRLTAYSFRLLNSEIGNDQNH